MKRPEIICLAIAAVFVLASICYAFASEHDSALVRLDADSGVQTSLKETALTEQAMLSAEPEPSAEESIAPESGISPLPEAPLESSAVEKTEPEPEIININTASSEQLCTLPGIGETLAARIIEYRNAQHFTAKEDIMNVKGIGEKTYAKFSSLITVE